MSTAYDFEIQYFNGTRQMEIIESMTSESITLSEAWHRLIQRLETYKTVEGTKHRALYQVKNISLIH